MNGLLRRLTRRAATADESPRSTPAGSEPVDATAVHPAPEGVAAASPAEDDERIRRRRDIPAGVDPDRLEPAATDGARSARLRRRTRFLRRAREVLLRDLGGFYYELHRSAGGAQHAGHRDILETKAGRLAALDHELRALEERLGATGTPQTLVREPGIGGTCPSCGDLHASDAHWCARCGTPLSDRARRRHEQEIDAAIAGRQAAAAERARAAEQAREAPAGAGDGGAPARAETGARADGETAARARPETGARADGETAARADGETAARARGETAARAHGETAARAHGETAARAGGESSPRADGESSARAHGDGAAQGRGDGGDGGARPTDEPGAARLDAPTRELPDTIGERSR